MSLPTELRTDRLLLRRWVAADRGPFAELNADARVMEHFPGVLTRAESDAMVERIEAHFERHGFGLWAVEVREQSSFIGFVGLAVPSFEAHFTPCVEVGWRLAQQNWGLGYATEAARAAVTFGSRTAFPGRDRLIHRAGERTLPPRDESSGYDARSGR